MIMIRQLQDLKNTEFDLVIVGGGIFGACAAWDASLRGLSVALVERTDFGAGVSANSFKIVHGGIRYLQHADIVRLRASCRERSAMLRIAPHLVQPLPIVIPTYGHAQQGKAFLGAGMLLYDVLTIGRNHGIADPQRQIPWSRFLSRRSLLELFPSLDQKGLTGAAVFCDGQMYNPTRLVWAFVRSAISKGCRVANYVEATGFLRNGDRIQGINVRDVLTGDAFPIRAKAVLNAAGPWAERLLGVEKRLEILPRTYSRDACFVIKRRFHSPFALAISGRTRDPDAVLSRAARHLFLVPWRDRTLVGVWHIVYGDSPDSVSVSEQDLATFIDEINWACPELNLTINDVTMWNAGLVPFGENEPGAENLRYGKRSTLIDHKKEHNIDGLVTLIGVRYTVARGESAKAIDLICDKLGRRLARPATEYLPIHGGKIDSFEDLVRKVRQDAAGLTDAAARALAHNYGTEYPEVLRMGERTPDMLRPFEASTVLPAEVLHAVRSELAVRLGDVVFRRTDLATGGHPGDSALLACANLMQQELGWTDEQRDTEIRDVVRRFAISH